MTLGFHGVAVSRFYCALIEFFGIRRGVGKWEEPGESGIL